MHEADQILYLEDGRIKETGDLKQLLSIDAGFVVQLVQPSNNEYSNGQSSREDVTTLSGTTAHGGTRDFEEEIEDAESVEDSDETSILKPTRSSVPVADMKESSLSLRRASSTSFRGPRGTVTDDEETGNKTTQNQEVSEQGKVKWSVYAEYAKTSNLAAVAVYIMTLVAAQTAQIGKDPCTNGLRRPTSPLYQLCIADPPLRWECLAQGLVRDECKIWEQPASRQIHRHLLCFWNWICCARCCSNAGSVDILFY